MKAHTPSQQMDKKRTPSLASSLIMRCTMNCLSSGKWGGGAEGPVRGR